MIWKELNAQPAAVQRLLTFADGENTSLHSSPGQAEISRNWLRFCPFSSLESVLWRTEWTAAGFCLLLGRMLQELRVWIDRSGPGFSLDAEQSHLACWELDFIATPRTQTEDFYFFFKFLLNVMFSLEREAAATNDELNTAAAAVGAQI